MILVLIQHFVMCMPGYHLIFIGDFCINFLSHLMILKTENEFLFWGLYWFYFHSLVWMYIGDIMVSDCCITMPSDTSLFDNLCVQSPWTTWSSHPSQCHYGISGGFCMWLAVFQAHSVMSNACKVSTLYISEDVLIYVIHMRMIFIIEYIA